MFCRSRSAPSIALLARSSTARRASRASGRSSATSPGAPAPRGRRGRPPSAPRRGLVPPPRSARPRQATFAWQRRRARVGARCAFCRSAATPPPALAAWTAGTLLGPQTRQQQLRTAPAAADHRLSPSQPWMCMRPAKQRGLQRRPRHVRGLLTARGPSWLPVLPTARFEYCKWRETVQAMPSAIASQRSWARPASELSSVLKAGGWPG